MATILFVYTETHNVGLGTTMMKRIVQLDKEDETHKIELCVVADKVVTPLYKK